MGVCPMPQVFLPGTNNETTTQVAPPSSCTPHSFGLNENRPAGTHERTCACVHATRLGSSWTSQPACARPVSEQGKYT